MSDMRRILMNMGCGDVVAMKFDQEKVMHLLLYTFASSFHFK